MRGVTDHYLCDDGHTFTHTPFPLLESVGWAEWKWKLLPVQHLLKKWTQLLLSIEFVSENEGVKAGRVDSHWRYCWLNDRLESKSKRPGAAGAFPHIRYWWASLVKEHGGGLIITDTNNGDHDYCENDNLEGWRWWWLGKSGERAVSTRQWLRRYRSYDRGFKLFDPVIHTAHDRLAGRYQLS